MKPDLASMRAQAERWQAEHDHHAHDTHIESLLADYSPAELLDAWGTGNGRDGLDLTQEQFESLCENLLRVFGTVPDGEAGLEAPPAPGLTPRQADRQARDNELSAINDDDLLTRKDTARLIGISLESLDRYVRKCEALGGVVLQPLRATERNVRYRACDVKAVRAGLLASSRLAMEHRQLEATRYASPRLPGRPQAQRVRTRSTTILDISKYKPVK